MQLTGCHNGNEKRNATCAASKTSEVPTQDALLFISYSMPKVQQSLLFFKVEAYRTDPLVDHNGVKLRFVIVFSDTVEKIKQLIPSIQWPFLVIHGDDDKLTYIGGSQFLEKEAKSEDKEIKVGVIIIS